MNAVDKAIQIVLSGGEYHTRIQRDQDRNKVFILGIFSRQGELLLSFLEEEAYEVLDTLDALFH